uniref:Uncharacterized protein n=1 Tax=Vespula pensylvanica TaxID=30213 RepID=A0A834NPX6_VESPE|nr:hypothetical protein H0235_011976 [Vespula pensylvanica]
MGEGVVDREETAEENAWKCIPGSVAQREQQTPLVPTPIPLATIVFFFYHQVPEAFATTPCPTTLNYAYQSGLCMHIPPRTTPSSFPLFY